MIDAIRPVYSSIHGGRGQNSRTPQTFNRSIRGVGDSFALSKAATKSKKDWAGLFFVSGGIAAISFIADILSSAGSNVDSMGKIVKNAGIWAVAGGILFCGFKCIERACLGGK